MKGELAPVNGRSTSATNMLSGERRLRAEELGVVVMVVSDWVDH